MMPLFGKPPSDKEVRAFRAGKTSSAKAAEAYARKQADKAAEKKALAENRAARKRK